MQIKNGLNKVGATEHNEFDGIQGGTTNQYFHLNSQQLAAVNDVISGDGKKARGIFDLSFGEMYIPGGGAQTVTVSIADTAYEITTGYTQGILQNSTFVSHYLTAGEIGTYKVSWSFSLGTTVPLDSIEGGFMVNGVAQSNGAAHATVSSANASNTVSSNGLVVLAVGDEVSLYVKNHTAARDITVRHVSCIIERIL
jgi:hypothetical protein